LNFARALAAANIPGVAGRALTHVAGTIAKEDLAIISIAIEEECEQVNPTQ
jgi:thymidine phosphorylase